MPEIDALLERQRLLARVLNRGADADPDRVNVTSPADANADRDMLALRRAELGIAPREALRDSAGGERSVAIAGNNSGIVSTGDGAKNTLHQ
ncbi:hypothetical protein [Streptomyces sp. NBC_01481]|uniref:hypothetical protein n=1 Tax=Streptomyces sp. NBC_01481 TaxID=2975869 RepID=UPI0022527375|nr:hypothetical protein [Streptomyces sp. NBC_01481]MCX4585217.1 hypothetical protein [Streptomyces sp. NBC_01481]